MLTDNGNDEEGADDSDPGGNDGDDDNDGGNDDNDGGETADGHDDAMPGAKRKPPPPYFLRSGAGATVACRFEPDQCSMLYSIPFQFHQPICSAGEEQPDTSITTTRPHKHVCFEDMLARASEHVLSLHTSI